MSKATKIITRPDLKSFVGAIQNAVIDGWTIDPFSSPVCANGSYTVTLQQEIKTALPAAKEKPAVKSTDSSILTPSQYRSGVLWPSTTNKFDPGL